MSTLTDAELVEKYGAMLLRAEDERDALRAENERLREARDEALGLLNANEDVAKSACVEAAEAMRAKCEEIARWYIEGSKDDAVQRIADAIADLKGSPP